MIEPITYVPIADLPLKVPNPSPNVGGGVSPERRGGGHAVTTAPAPLLPPVAGCRRSAGVGPHSDGVG